jgi:hypothetical protein
MPKPLLVVRYTPPLTELMEKRLAAIRVVQAGPQKWEVNANDVRTAMESGEKIVNYVCAGRKAE